MRFRWISCSLLAIATSVGCFTADAPDAAREAPPATVEDELKGGAKLSCGLSTCEAGEVCCNASCGICTPPDGFCTQQICDPADLEPCGDAVCPLGEVCCNASCGICTPPGMACTQQACERPTKPACASDADCELAQDYCTGCDCRALAPGESLPPCDGPGVQCLVDPCADRKAACVSGECIVK